MVLRDGAWRIRISRTGAGIGKETFRAAIDARTGRPRGFAATTVRWRPAVTRTTRFRDLVLRSGEVTPR